MSGTTARRAAVTAASSYNHTGQPLDWKAATSLFGSNVTLD